MNSESKNQINNIENKLILFSNNLKKENGKGLIIYENSTDGICSCSILTNTLNELNLDYSIICIENIDLLSKTESIHHQYDFFIILASYIPTKSKFVKINDLNKNIYIISKKNDLLENQHKIYDLNVDITDSKSLNSASMSTLSYLVSKKINNKYVEFAWLSAIGSSSLNIPFNGSNWTVLKEAERIGDIFIQDSKKENIQLNISKTKKNIKTLAKDFSILASVMYNHNESEGIVSSCVSKNIHSLLPKIKNAKDKQKTAFKNLRNQIEDDGLFSRSKIQWFDASLYLTGMSGNVLDSFTLNLRYQTRFIHKNKYIIGITDIKPFRLENEFKDDWIRISVQVPQRLESEISKNNEQPVSSLIEASSYHSGGSGYGFDISGYAYIPRKTTLIFLKMFEDLSISNNRDLPVL